VAALLCIVCFRFTSQSYSYDLSRIISPSIVFISSTMRFCSCDDFEN
jgi:hypothetical protein